MAPGAFGGRLEARSQLMGRRTNETTINFTNFTRLLLFFVLGASLCLTFGPLADAGSITYPNPVSGSFPGATVIYGPDFGPGDHGVTESSVTDPVPLFGPPTVSG